MLVTINEVIEVSLFWIYFNYAKYKAAITPNGHLVASGTWHLTFYLHRKDSWSSHYTISTEVV
jgi:hypothetical protein